MTNLTSANNAQLGSFKALSTCDISKVLIPAKPQLIASPVFCTTMNERTLHQANNLIERYFDRIEGLKGQVKWHFNNGHAHVQIPYYLEDPEAALDANSVNILSEGLSQLLGIEVIAKMVRLHYPYLDRSIVARYVAINSTEYRFQDIIRRIFDSVIVQSLQGNGLYLNHSNVMIVGVKVKLGGRLITERSKPRMTTRVAEIGSFTRSRSAYTIEDSYTTKNAKNALTVHVKLHCLVARSS